MADDKTTKTPEQPVMDSGPGKEMFLYPNTYAEENCR